MECLKRKIKLKLKNQKLKKNSLKIKIVLGSLLSLFFISCNSNYQYENVLYGNLYISSLYMNKHYLTDECSYEINFERNSNWLTIINLNSNIIYSAKFEFLNKKKDSLKISNSKFIGLNGLYKIKVDTLTTSEENDEISITLKSKNVYLKGYKNVIKKLGNL